ncbi:MAG TPA: ChbG/HpnK family deacetylase [Gemmatimonadales bacterium]|jgi:predicted glycoside hydrolase/deacetylase ChbG (UPF0249 family)
MRAACCATSPESAGTERSAVTPDRRLIINADDFGLSPGVNAGILKAVRAGIVTSISVMVNTPAFDAGMRALADVSPAPSVGLHLNLTAGTPLSPSDSVASLVDRAGRFHSLAALARRAALGLVRGDDVERETRAQLARLRERWPGVTHLDGHQHAHALPGVWRAVLRAAAVRVFRRPIEPAFLPGRPGTIKRAVLGLVFRVSGGAAGAVRVRGIGMHGDRNYLDELLRVIDELPEGITELIVHPGCADATVRALDSYDAPREQELAALLSLELRGRLGRKDVGLTSFADETPLTA